mmetsp:Transcript_70656/g.228846  ORF Transcript_70656/g.228846 Transcript_70656/m.228846 type:complete len:348 (+) Transcript_70656:320-1363(+)
MAEGRSNVVNIARASDFRHVVLTCVGVPLHKLPGPEPLAKVGPAVQLEEKWLDEGDLPKPILASEEGHHRTDGLVIPLLGQASGNQVGVDVPTECIDLRDPQAILDEAQHLAVIGLHHPNTFLRVQEPRAAHVALSKWSRRHPGFAELTRGLLQGRKRALATDACKPSRRKLVVKPDGILNSTPAGCQAQADGSARRLRRVNFPGAETPCIRVGRVLRPPIRQLERMLFSHPHHDGGTYDGVLDEHVPCLRVCAVGLEEPLHVFIGDVRIHCQAKLFATHRLGPHVPHCLRVDSALQDDLHPAARLGVVLNSSVPWMARVLDGGRCVHCMVVLATIAEALRSPKARG